MYLMQAHHKHSVTVWVKSSEVSEFNMIKV